MKNKKAAEMTIGTIVVIILAIIVLVVLVYGFTTGWSDMWNKIVSFGGGAVNVQDIVQSCEISCATQQEYNFCKKTRNVVFDETQKAEKLTCDQLKGRGVGLSCDMVNCVGFENSGGVCNGQPDSLRCNSQNNRGADNCRDFSGCVWQDNIASDEVNQGDCNLDPSFTCAQFNNDETGCRTIGCDWV
jgi:hypothetical protein